MITLDLVTPARKIVEGAQVTSLTLPTVKGEMTVLDQHADLIAIVGTGQLTFVRDGSETRYAVSGGFAEISHNRAIVLAESCEAPSEIDRAAAEREQREAEEALSGK